MDNILYETTKHPIYVIMKICEYLFGYMIFVIGLFVLDYIYPIGGYFWLFGILGIIICGIFSYIYFDRFSKSKLVITNNRIYMIVQNGLWSSYEMSIYRSNIKDFAYTRNNILHKILDYGNLRIRSGTNKESEFYAGEMPDIGHIYSIINFLYTIPTSERQHISNLPLNLKNNKKAHNDEDIKKLNNIESEILSKIKKVKGITLGIVLNNIDREYIGTHEEERNHGVYECIRKKYLLCVSHDGDFRNPDADIVVNYNGKIIFPAVPFHEVQLSSTISSSPSILVHKYLCDRFDKKLGENDATILIGFDDL